MDNYFTDLAQTSAIHAKTGMWPGLLGKWYRQQKFGQEVTPDILTYSANGGIVTVTLVLDNPDGSDLFTSPNQYVDFGQLLDAGTSLNSWLNSQLEIEAANLQALADADIPVVYRPFQEMNGDPGPNCPWWACKPGGEYISFWIYVQSYLINKKGLHNLLFLWSPNGGYASPPLQTWYPGDQYVDMVGIDVYDHGTDLSGYPASHYNEVVALTNKPFVLAEFGSCSKCDATCPAIDWLGLLSNIEMFMPRTVYWMAWSTDCGMDYSGNSNLAALLSDPRVINRPVSYLGTANDAGVGAPANDGGSGTSGRSAEGACSALGTDERGSLADTLLICVGCAILGRRRGRPSR
jgi:mannan endo-1,4-beta-mannosidase